jgi:hypothetical protein
MEGIVLTDDELRILERRFGQGVRKMGSWNSDGTFGYSWISMAVVERASESLEDPKLRAAVSRLNDAADRTGPFLTLLETFGRPLIEKIIAVYKQGFWEVTRGASPGKKPAERLTRAAAAG